MQQLLALISNLFAADLILLVFYAASTLFCLLFTYFLWLFIPSSDTALPGDHDRAH